MEEVVRRYKKLPTSRQLCGPRDICGTFPSVSCLTNTLELGSRRVTVLQDGRTYLWIAEWIHSAEDIEALMLCLQNAAAVHIRTRKTCSCILEMPQY